MQVLWTGSQTGSPERIPCPKFFWCSCWKWQASHLKSCAPFCEENDFLLWLGVEYVVSQPELVLQRLKSKGSYIHHFLQAWKGFCMPNSATAYHESLAGRLVVLASVFGCFRCFVPWPLSTCWYRIPLFHVCYHYCTASASILGFYMHEASYIAAFYTVGMRNSTNQMQLSYNYIFIYSLFLMSCKIPFQIDAVLAFSSCLVEEQARRRCHEHP